MEALGILIPAILYIVLIIVLYSIIKNATKSDSLYKEAIRQSLFLEAIAKKNGVTEQELEAINKSVERVTREE